MNIDDPYEERTPDLIERIRRMRDAAQREMDRFGDPAGYDTRKIVGQKKTRSNSSEHPAEGTES